MNHHKNTVLQLFWSTNVGAAITHTPSIPVHAHTWRQSLDPLSLRTQVWTCTVICPPLDQNTAQGLTSPHDVTSMPTGNHSNDTTNTKPALFSDSFLFSSSLCDCGRLWVYLHHLHVRCLSYLSIWLTVTLQKEAHFRGSNLCVLAVAGQSQSITSPWYLFLPFPKFSDRHLHGKSSYRLQYFHD